eukprot:1149999-Pelagomonas_calceolata.AAC.2
MSEEHRKLCSRKCGCGLRGEAQADRSRTLEEVQDSTLEGGFVLHRRYTGCKQKKKERSASSRAQGQAQEARFLAD